MDSSDKVTLYNQADLKNATDDAVPEYLNSLKFKQSHYYLNVRLALGYSSFVLAAACFAWDYYLGWDKTKKWTQIAVIVYMGLSWQLHSWTQNVEKGAIYNATAPSGEKILISTANDKYVPNYKVTAIIVGTEPNAKPTEFSFERRFNEWFDETGRLVARPLQEAFATEIPLIGKLDPSRVRTQSHDELSQNPELLDAVSQAAAAAAGGKEASSTSAEASEKKGGKRRKV